MQDYVIDDTGMAFVHADGKGVLIPTMQLVQNLDDGEEVTSGATKIIALGRDIKLARGPKINVGGQKVSTWAYVLKEADGSKMVLLAKDTLQELRAIPFDGNYATAGADDEIYIVLHVTAGADVDQADAHDEQHMDADAGTDADIAAGSADEPEEHFKLTRVSTAKFVGDQPTV